MAEPPEWSMSGKSTSCCKFYLSVKYTTHNFDLTETLETFRIYTEQNRLLLIQIINLYEYTLINRLKWYMNKS